MPDLSQRLKKNLWKAKIPYNHSRIFCHTGLFSCCHHGSPLGMLLRSCSVHVKDRHLWVSKSHDPCWSSHPNDSASTSNQLLQWAAVRWLCPRGLSHSRAEWLWKAPLRPASYCVSVPSKLCLQLLSEVDGLVNKKEWAGNQQNAKSVYFFSSTLSSWEFQATVPNYK